MQQGFDKLSEDANKILEDTIKHIDAIPEKLDEVADRMINNLDGHYQDVQTELQSIVNETGTKLDEIAAKELNVNVNTPENLPDVSPEVEKITTTSILADTIMINGKAVSLDKIEEQLSKNQDEVIEQKVAEQKSGGTTTTPATKPPTTTQSGPVSPIGPGQQKLLDQIKADQNMLDNAIKEYQKAVLKQDKLQATGAAKDKIDAATKDVNAKKKAYESALKAVQANQSAYKSITGKTLSVAQYTNPIGDIIRTGTAHPAKATTAEKKNHHKLWIGLVNEFGYAPNNTVYTKLANALGVSVSKTVTNSEKTKILEALKKAGYSKLKGYRKGSHSILEDELNWLHDKEVVVRKSDGAILQPFNAGDMVFTSKQSENLWKMSQISPDIIKKMIANPDMSKYKQPGITDKFGAYTHNENQTIHFDSLITINGNADQQTVADLQQIAQGLVNNREFKSNVIKFVTRDMTREAAKAGYRGR